MIYFLYRFFQCLIDIYKYSSLRLRYAFTSKETSCYTYDLTNNNEIYLAYFISQILNKPMAEVVFYFDELKTNIEFRNEIVRLINNSKYKYKKNSTLHYGIRLCFYAVVRINKPKILVENGIDIGFTSCVLCEAIRRNMEEGYEGKYIGIDINTQAGYLVKKNNIFDFFSTILYGDGINILESLNSEIDFYFSDGFRTRDYEIKELDVLSEKFNKNSIFITNKANFSDAFYKFSVTKNLKFSIFQEQPNNHWYNGALFGFISS
jgi:hypothetical protein